MWLIAQGMHVHVSGMRINPHSALVTLTAPPHLKSPFSCNCPSPVPYPRKQYHHGVWLGVTTDRLRLSI